MTKPAPGPDQPPIPVRLVTFNTRHGVGTDDALDLPRLAKVLQSLDADIVCLQELKAPQERFPLAEIRKAGYGAIWHGEKAWNGVAILARGAGPVETRRGLPGDPADRHSRYIEAPVGGLTIGCLYLPNGNPARGRNSTTSWPGWTGCTRMRSTCSTAAFQRC